MPTELRNVLPIELRNLLTLIILILKRDTLKLILVCLLQLCLQYISRLKQLHPTSGDSGQIVFSNVNHNHRRPQRLPKGGANATKGAKRGGANVTKGARGGGALSILQS